MSYLSHGITKSQQTQPSYFNNMTLKYLKRFVDTKVQFLIIRFINEVFLSHSPVCPRVEKHRNVLQLTTIQ